MRWGWIALALWAMATAAAFLLHHQGVRQEPVQLTLADGTRIHAVLYRSGGDAPEAPAPAAVVLHGMAVTHRSCEAALTMPLARCGFVVLALDLRGHGRSGGSLPKSWFRDLDDILQRRTDSPEAETALCYLRSLPHVDGNRIGLLGHSLGGLAAVNTACTDTAVASVVAISVAPQMCDAQRPRNLFLLAGDLDRLVPPSHFLSAIRRATDGLLDHADPLPIGDLEDGTGRQLCIAHWVSHMSPLFDPTASRRAVQWTGNSAGLDPGSVPGGRLIAIGCTVVLAVLAGGVACTVLIMKLAERILPATSESEGSWRRTAAALVLGLGMAPAAAFLSEGLPDWGVLYAASTLVLFVLLALIWLMAGWRLGRPSADRSAAWRGTVIGMLAALLGIVWLGLPLGATWLDLMPCTRRVAVGLLLLPLFLPWSLLLAHGVQRVVPARRRWFGMVRGLAWLAIPAALWIGSELFNSRQPFFGIAVSLLAAAFVLPLPLWLLEDRKGMTLARAISLAVSAAWLFSCHLPFVSG
jgi:dienelactone hydrolase